MTNPFVLAWIAMLLAPQPAAPAPDGCAPGPVAFCGRTWPADTTALTCYEGRGREEAMDLGPLACLVNLRELTIVSGEIEFVEHLRVKDLKPLSGLRHLRFLSLGEVLVEDLAPIGELTGLEKLRLHASTVRDLGFLRRLTALVELELSSVKVTDIAPLAALERLERLDLRCTGVVDLAPLAGLRLLRRVNLTATPATDLSPLLQLEHLEWIGLRAENSVPPSQIAALKKRFPGLAFSDGGGCCAAP